MPGPSPATPHFKPVPFLRSLTIAALLAPAAMLHPQTPMASCHNMSKNVGAVAPADLPVPQKLTGIGNLHFPISSHNPETQAWFDQAINLVYDFWDYEANRAFEQAIRTDPNCAICHWGLAESLGIHNGEAAGYAHYELTKAIALRPHADKRERLYIDASQAEEKASEDKDGQSGDTVYVSILRKIVHKYSTDLTARIMLASAVSDGYDDGKPRKGKQESLALLQEALRQSPDSSAANHLWIHAVEASPHPEQALQSSDALARLAPNSGHMTHMPGHIFFRTGNYERAQVSFDLSTSVDEAYMQSQHVAVDDDWNYVHNLMYSIANLLEQGKMDQAAIVSAKLTAARGRLAATLYPWSPRDSITRINVQLPVALRSGDWSRVVSMLADAKAPADQANLQSLNVALTDFAQGMQSVQSKNLESAAKQSQALDAELWRISEQLDEQAAADKKKPKTPAAPTNKPTPTDAVLNPLLKSLAILSLELRAAIDAQSNKLNEAKALFAQARRQEQDLGYHEPPVFIRPVAEQEAEIMVAAGESTEAATDWKLALEDRPNSGFPLYGLAQLAESAGDAAKTAKAYQDFLTAWKSADPKLPQVEHARQWMAKHSKQNAQAQSAHPSTGD